MPEFQQLSCHVALGGDIRNVVVRDRFEPITYPEYLCMIVTHGEGAITNVEDIGEPVTRSEADERLRLEQKFGKDVVKLCFPGMGLEMPTKSGKFPVAKAPEPAPTPAPEPAPAPAPEPAPVSQDTAPVDPAVAVPPLPKKKG